MTTKIEFNFDKDFYSQISNLSKEEFTDVFFTKLNNNSDLALKLTQKMVSLTDQLGKLWNLEHDHHGVPLSKGNQIKISTDDLSLIWEKIKLLSELIRSRLPLEISEPKIAVGTLLNTHHVSQLVDLQIRITTKILTYYWGTELTLEKIKIQMKNTPEIDIMVLSVMAINSKLNAFKEVKKIRKEFPNKIIIVGGAAWPILELLRLDPTHPSLSTPYKDKQYLDLLLNVDSIKEFVEMEFGVNYCQNIGELIDIIEKEQNNLKMVQAQE